MLLATDGMNWAIPCAPARLTTPSLKPLSCQISRMKKPTGSALSSAAEATIAQSSSRDGAELAVSPDGLSGVALPAPASISLRFASGRAKSDDTGRHTPAKVKTAKIQ